jgi:L-ascorbate metabolism protein UlaG (beta-lactamase superfamily)
VTELKIVHLYHSGILVETKSHQLFFDAISDIHMLLDPTKEVVFFVSHGHQDHFDPLIYKYRLPHVHYFISDEIRNHPKEDYTYVRPNHHYKRGTIDIQTYDSTDSGVSFLVTFEDRVLFHAGDLNWWHWQNDNESTQKEEEKQFKHIVDGILVPHIHVAFLPLDPRLNEAYTWTTEYFLKTKSISHIVPIHFRNHFEVTKTLRVHLKNDPRIVVIQALNEHVLTL